MRSSTLATELFLTEKLDGLHWLHALFPANHVCAAMSAVSACSYYIIYSSSFSEAYFDVARSTRLGICLALPHFCPVSSAPLSLPHRYLIRRSCLGSMNSILLGCFSFPRRSSAICQSFRHQLVFSSHAALSK